MEEQSDYLYKLSPSIVFCLGKSLKPLILSFTFFIAAFWFNWLSFGGVFCLGIAWYQFLYNRNTCYYLTKEVIRVRTGLFTLQTNQLELFRVKDYVIIQTFLMRMFNIMTVQLHTTDISNKVIHLAGIPYSNIVDQIRNRVLEARTKNRIFELN
jgi:uncharacterized membrane protein YdbT with pleckstrin-like domain